MTQAQLGMLGALAILTTGGVLVGRHVLSDEQKDLATQLTIVGLVGTAIGVPLGLWAVPAFSDKPWLAALILTGASYATKAAMLPHGEHEPEPSATELGKVYV